MKNKLSPSLLKFIPFVFLLTVAACSDKDAPKDDIAPVLIVTGVDNNATINNVVSLTANASDDNGVTAIEIYVDDVLFKTLTTPPFEVTWDSNTVQDGIHTIKFVAIDKAGNRKEETFALTVKNVLLDISVATDVLITGERAFVYLSDADGKLIASTEVKNGKNVELKSSTFKGETFYLTEVLHSSRFLYNTMTWTYVQIKRGRVWNVLYPTSDAPEPVGKATLNFTGSNLQSYTFSSNAEMANLEFGETQYDIDLATNTSSLFVMKNEPDVAYALFHDIKVNTQNTIDVTQVNKPMIKKSVVSPDDDEALIDVFVWGYPTANNYTNGCAFDNYAHTDVNDKAYFYYPGNAFPSYFHEVWWHTDYMDYTGRGKGTDINVKLPAVTFSHEFKNNKLTFSVAGDFDLFSMTMYGDDAIWFFMVPEGQNQSIPALEQPAILNDIDQAAFGPIAEYFTSEMASIDGYEDFMNKLRSVSVVTNDSDFDNTVDVTYFVDSQGGRKAKLDKKSRRNSLRFRRF